MPAPDWLAGALPWAMDGAACTTLVVTTVRTGSGVAAIETISRVWPVRYLFVSGDTLRDRVLLPGAIVLQKPYNESDLAKAIEHALGDQ